MSAPLLGRCPGCKQTLRLPETATGKTIRCVRCGMVSQVNPTAKLVARRAAAVAAAPVQPAVVPQPAAAIPMAMPVVATAVQASPVAAVAPSADAWSMIADETYGESATPTSVARRRRGGGGFLGIIIAMFVILCALGVTAAGVVVLVLMYNQRDRELVDDQPPATSTEKSQPKPVTGASDGAFPRRLLGISVNNYIFANPTSYGFDSRNFIRRDFGQTVEKLANRLRIPTNQTFELSDGARGAKQRPPLKPIIEQTITRFVESSRPQDRVILMLCAHTVEVEKKPYIVPLEGDMDDVKTLIPLDWVMSQLEKCPAQQKLLIADFNRYDKARGTERPSGGKLAASTEAMLKNPPKGVQVWSACSAGQYSYEFDNFYDFKGQAIKGGAFISLFSVAFAQGMTGIQKPDEALPIDRLAKSVNASLIELSSDFEDVEGDEPESPAADEKKDAKKDDKKPAKPAKSAAKQVPFLAGEPGPTVAFDANEAPAKPIVIPKPEEVFTAGIVPRGQVKAMMDVFALPPIKQASATDSVVRFDEVLPFMADKMGDYVNGTTVAEIKKNPTKFPLRAAVVEAIEKIRKLDEGGISLPTELVDTERNEAFNMNLARLQREPARILKTIEEILEALQVVATNRKEEKSKFWQATLDYVLAQAKARYVYVNEFNSVMGIVRKDALPPLDKKDKLHVGWRLASSEQLTNTESEIKDLNKEKRKLFEKLAKEHPGTPWEVLAKREKSTSLGLRWEPFSREKPDAKDNDKMESK